MTHDLVEIGKVVKAHGIRGEVAVHVLSDVPGRFDPGTRVHLAGRVTDIESSRPHQGRMLVRFTDVHDRTAAERLRGQLIRAEPADVSESETYYVHELIGMAVVDDAGSGLGTVSALIELPDAAGYDLLEVAADDGTVWLLPAVDDFVDVERGPGGEERLRLTDAPDGLIDPSRAVPAHDDDLDSGR